MSDRSAVRQHSRAEDRSWWLPAGIVIAATAFNAVLAFVNGNVVGLGPAHVILAEVSIVLVAHLVALSNYRREMNPWYILLAVLMTFALVRSIYLEQIDVKYLRDMMIIPTFVVLGMTFNEKRIVQAVAVIHLLVLAVLVIEAVSTPLYSAIFRVMDYYINTRGNNVQDFWNTDSDLYVSATRSEARLFSFVPLHRMSSLFVEPVSLGNYCIVITGFICAFYARMRVQMRWFFIVGNVLVLLGSDGRLALVSCLLIIAATFIAPRLSPRLPALYLPGAVLFAFLVTVAGDLKGGEDNFPGRIAYSVELMSGFDLRDMLGLSNELLSRAVDSGISYMILTQSVLVVMFAWYVITCTGKMLTREQIIYCHAICIYIALNCIVSYAFLTIKTAALLWFIQGALQNQGAAFPVRVRGEGGRAREDLGNLRVPGAAGARAALN